MILGVDPGRDKFGWAFAGPAKELLFSGISPVKDRELFWRAVKRLGRDPYALDMWALEHPLPIGTRASLRAVVVGGGTCGGEFVADAEGRQLGCRVVSVDERGTTLEARGLYWSLHRPSWWRRLLPRTLWVPPRPVDDLAAWAIAMRGMDEMAL